MKKKIPVWVLIDEWQTEDSGGLAVVGVYRTVESAKKALREYVKLYDGPVYDTVKQTEWDYTTYTEGRYQEGYTNIMIVNSELEGDIK